MPNSRRRLLLAAALFLAALGLVLLGQAGLLTPVRDLALRAASGVQSSVSAAFFNVRDFLTASRNSRRKWSPCASRPPRWTA
jgi:hypothetical protein